MRLAPFALLSSIALAGCAGQLRDYVGAPRASIVTPQLLRFGFDLARSRCIAERLGEALTPSRLRKLARDAGAVTRAPLGPADFAWVVRVADDRRLRLAYENALERCPASPAPPAGTVAAPGVTILGPGQLPPPSGSTPQAEVPVERAPTWLNLGAAGPGQSIAIDAGSIVQEGPLRSAWFRMTDPGAAAPNDNAYLLRIDCANRTINAKARRRRGSDGAVAEQVDYPDNPLPVEGGTVMEIAWLSMCT